MIQQSAIERRYALKHEAGRLLGGRTARCGAYRHSNIIRLYRTDHGAKVQGVETCGSIWSCPVCAAKIAEGKRIALDDLLTAHHAAGGAAYMLTLTVPHARLDCPRRLRDGVMKSWSRMIAGRPWRRAVEDYAVVGNVRALEVTHGQNGWHPHLHVLLFTAAPLPDGDRQAMHGRLFEMWAAKVRDHMGATVAFAATDCRRVTEAADYVAKWGADSEIAKASQKISRKGGRSPWQLLADSIAGDKRAGALFCAYAAAFKGSRHLSWSKGLRERYGLRDTAADEDLAANGEDMELDLVDAGATGLIAEFDAATWDALAKRRLQGRVLSACAREGRAGVDSVLSAAGLGLYWQPEETAERRYRPGPRKLTAWDVAGLRDGLKHQSMRNAA